MSRRRFLTYGAAAGATIAWTPVLRIPASAAGDAPPDFPQGIDLYREVYENWAKAIRVEDAWTCAPRSAADVVRLADWAHAVGYRLRPKGASHGWSPMTFSSGEDASTRVILVDTKQHLTGLTIESVDGAPAVRAGAGATVDALLQHVEDAGFGFTSIPAIGEITVGGMLAIGGHGTSVPARGETLPPGHTYGSLSNLILRITAVVWDEDRGAFAIRTFERSSPQAAALLVHLGRAFVTDVTLRLGANQSLQCESIVDVPVAELLGPTGATRRTMASYLDSAGRLEVLWFPFADYPWLKVWRVAPTKPVLSREVTSPYNYPFSDNLPDEFADLAAEMLRGNGAVTPLFNQMTYAAVVAGLTATASRDIWGLSKNVLLYIRSSTFRVEQPGHAVLVRRSDVQRVVDDFRKQFVAMRDRYAANGEYPVNMPVEIRVSGIDRTNDAASSRARAAHLSSLAEVPGHPDRDTAVWFNIVTLTGTPGASRFYREIEDWMYAHYSTYATVRPEWSKGWAYTDDGAWQNRVRLETEIPAAYGEQRWRRAVEVLDGLDPRRVFTNPFLDRLLT